MESSWLSPSGISSPQQSQSWGRESSAARCARGCGKETDTASALSLQRVTPLPGPKQSVQTDRGKSTLVELLHLPHFKSKMVRKKSSILTA